MPTLCYQGDFHQYQETKTMAAKMASALKTYHGSARREWTICLIDYNGIGHVVHDNVLKCHVGGCTASWRVGPGLDPNAI